MCPVDLLLGYSLLHVAIPDRNAGDCLIPGTIGPPGSGKFCTPCERMQFANSSATVLPLAVPADLLDRPKLGVVVGAGPRLATAGVFDARPQPAAASTSSANVPTRQMRP